MAVEQSQIHSNSRIRSERQEQISSKNKNDENKPTFKKQQLVSTFEILQQKTLDPQNVQDSEKIDIRDSTELLQVSQIEKILKNETLVYDQIDKNVYGNDSVSATTKNDQFAIGGTKSSQQIQDLKRVLLLQEDHHKQKKKGVGMGGQGKKEMINMRQQKTMERRKSRQIRTNLDIRSEWNNSSSHNSGKNGQNRPDMTPNGISTFEEGEKNQGQISKIYSGKQDQQPIPTSTFINNTNEVELASCDGHPQTTIAHYQTENQSATSDANQTIVFDVASNSYFNLPKMGGKVSNNFDNTTQINYDNDNQNRTYKNSNEVSIVEHADQDNLREAIEIVADYQSSDDNKKFKLQKIKAKKGSIDVGSTHTASLTHKKLTSKVQQIDQQNDPNEFPQKLAPTPTFLTDKRKTAQLPQQSQLFKVSQAFPPQKKSQHVLPSSITQQKDDQNQISPLKQGQKKESVDYITTCFPSAAKDQEPSVSKGDFKSDLSTDKQQDVKLVSHLHLLQESHNQATDPEINKKITAQNKIQNQNERYKDYSNQNEKMSDHENDSAQNTKLKNYNPDKNNQNKENPTGNFNQTTIIANINHVNQGELNRKVPKKGNRTQQVSYDENQGLKSLSKEQSLKHRYRQRQNTEMNDEESKRQYMSRKSELLKPGLLHSYWVGPMAHDKNTKRKPKYVEKGQIKEKVPDLVSEHEQKVVAASQSEISSFRGKKHHLSEIELMEDVRAVGTGFQFGQFIPKKANQNSDGESEIAHSDSVEEKGQLRQLYDGFVAKSDKEEKSPLSEVNKKSGDKKKSIEESNGDEQEIETPKSRFHRIARAQSQKKMKVQKSRRSENQFQAVDMMPVLTVDLVNQIFEDRDEENPLFEIPKSRLFRVNKVRQNEFELCSPKSVHTAYQSQIFNKIPNTLRNNNFVANSVRVSYNLAAIQQNQNAFMRNFEGPSKTSHQLMDYQANIPPHFYTNQNTNNPPSLMSSAKNFNQKPAKKSSEKLITKASQKAYQDQNSQISNRDMLNVIMAPSQNIIKKPSAQMNYPKTAIRPSETTLIQETTNLETQNDVAISLKNLQRKESDNYSAMQIVDEKQLHQTQTNDDNLQMNQQSEEQISNNFNREFGQNLQPKQVQQQINSGQQQFHSTQEVILAAQNNQSSEAEMMQQTLIENFKNMQEQMKLLSQTSTNLNQTQQHSQQQQLVGQEIRGNETSSFLNIPPNNEKDVDQKSCQSTDEDNLNVGVISQNAVVSYSLRLTLVEKSLRKIEFVLSFLNSTLGLGYLVILDHTESPQEFNYKMAYLLVNLIKFCIVFALSLVSIIGLKCSLRHIYGSLDPDYLQGRKKSLENIVQRVTNEDQQLAILQQIVSLQRRISLQSLYLPQAYLSGLARFLPMADFSVNFHQVILFEIFFTTVPFLLITIFHSESRNYFTLYDLIALTVHIFNFLLPIRYAAQDEIQQQPLSEPKPAMSANIQGSKDESDNISYDIKAKLQKQWTLYDRKHFENCSSCLKHKSRKKGEGKRVNNTTDQSIAEKQWNVELKQNQNRQDKVVSGEFSIQAAKSREKDHGKQDNILSQNSTSKSNKELEKQLNYTEAEEVLKSLDWHFQDPFSFHKAKVIGKVSIIVVACQIVIGLGIMYILRNVIGDNIRFQLES